VSAIEFIDLITYTIPHADNCRVALSKSLTSLLPIPTPKERRSLYEVFSRVEATLDTSYHPVSSIYTPNEPLISCSFNFSVMISECALALALDGATLPQISTGGGILTPMTAFGDVLVERLKRSGYIDIESELLVGTEPRKTR
jgi:short subunit dehydrogenase-like uncharacterized protein